MIARDDGGGRQGVDTDGLRGMAGRLRTVASEVDLTADQQAEQAHAAQWVSTSGDVFRDSSLALRSTLQEGAAHLVDTAARLDAVADTVDERLAAIAAAAAAAAREVRETAEDIAHAVADAADAVGDAAVDAVEGLAEGAEDLAEGLGRVFR